MTVYINGTTGISGVDGSAGTPALQGTDTNTGISFGSDVIIGSTGGVERFRVDSQGRLGIGDNAPGSTLTVKGATGVTPLQISGPSSEFCRVTSDGKLLVGTSSSFTAYYNSTAAWAGLFQVARSDQNAVANFSIWDSNASTYTTYGGVQLHLSACKSGTVGSHTSGALANGDTIGTINFNASDGTNFRNAARIEAVVDAGLSTADVPGRLVFSTTADGASSPTERMRIQANGVIFLYNSAAFAPNVDNTATCGGNGFRWSQVWAANGTIQTSDERAKKEIADAQLGSDFIKSLRPVSYKWIEGGKRDTGERDEDNNYIYEPVPGKRTHWGFIAQEVKEAVDAAGVDFGGWVLTDKDDPDSQQALRYDQFIAPLTKALQEALQKIEDLEQRLTDAGIA